VKLEGEFTSVEKVYKSIVEEVTKQAHTFSKQSAIEKKYEKKVSFRQCTFASKAPPCAPLPPLGLNFELKLFQGCST
jgi:hypothetical protein